MPLVSPSLLEPLDTQPHIHRYPLILTEDGYVDLEKTACNQELQQLDQLQSSESQDSSNNRKHHYTFEYISHKSQLKELTILMNSLLEMRYSPYVYEYIIKTDSSRFSFLIRDSKGEVVAGMGCRLERSSSKNKNTPQNKSLSNDPSLPPSLDLCCMMLGVLSPHRRKGLARWMIVHAHQNALQFRGTEGEYISNFYLHVQTSNTSGKSFYEAVGFELIQTIENYYKRLDPPSCFVLARVIHDPDSYVEQQKVFLKQHREAIL